MNKMKPTISLHLPTGKNQVSNGTPGRQRKHLSSAWGGYGNNLLIQAGSEDTQDEDPILGLIKTNRLWIENYGNTNGTPGYNIHYDNAAYFGCTNGLHQGDAIFATVGNGT